MDWTNDFIIPVTKTVFIVGTSGFLFFVVTRFIYIKWNKEWKFFIKYKTKKPSVENIDLILSISDMDNTEIKKTLLIEGFKIKQINELLYIKKIIGGKTNGIKQTKRNG